MKETDEVLATILKKGLVVAEKTGQFVLENAPDLLQEFYAWHFGKRIFFIVLSIIIGIILYYIPYLWTSAIKTETQDLKAWGRYHNSMDGWEVCTVALRLVSICSITICIFTQGYHLIMMSVAPKLYIIEQLSSLMRK